MSSGWRMQPRRSMPVIGEWNERQTPRSPFDANVRPRSVIARRAGPAVLTKEYGPVTSTPATFSRGCGPATARNEPELFLPQFDPRALGSHAEEAGDPEVGGVEPEEEASGHQRGRRSASGPNRASRWPCSSGDQHIVDGVDDAVRGEHVGLVRSRRRRSALPPWCGTSATAFERLRRSQLRRLGGRDLALDDVVEQHRAQLALFLARAARVAFGTFANAASVGAKTVNGPSLRERSGEAGLLQQLP